MEKPCLSLSISAHDYLRCTLSSGRKELLKCIQRRGSRNKPVVEVHHMKSNEVLEFLVWGQLHDLRKVDLGLEGGVRLLVHAVPRALPLKPLVDLRKGTVTIIVKPFDILPLRF